MPSRAFRTLILLLATTLYGCSGNSGYVRTGGYAQGGTYSIIYKLPGKGKAAVINGKADSILLAIDNSLSGYNKGSLLSRINNGEDLPLDTIFVECFRRSKEIYELSQGAFDPSAAPLFDVWGFGFGDSTEVTEGIIDSLKQFTGMDKCQLEERDGKVFLHKGDPRIKLNFNAIAQGLSCDMIAGMLESHGCRDYLVEVGREMMCRGQREGGGPWHIGIDRPVDGDGSTEVIQEVVDVSDKGIVTSGNYHKFYIKDGKKYAHTIDPRTGYPVDHTLLSATVIARDATMADALATWFMVVGLEEAKAVIQANGNIDACLIYGGQSDMKVWKSRGLENNGNNTK